VLCGKKIYKKKILILININRSKDGIVLSVNNEISGDIKKYEIDQDSGQYSCQNFDKMFSIKIHLTILSKKFF
jgi:hypothetical protein